MCKNVHGLVCVCSEKQGSVRVMRNARERRRGCSALSKNKDPILVESTNEAAGDGRVCHERSAKKLGDHK